MVGQSKLKRQKVECSVCNVSFDSDYRKKHNEKYHGQMIAAHRSIPFKIVGCPESPFTFARKRKDSVPENASEENVQSTPKESLRKPEENTTEGQFSVEPNDEASVSIVHQSLKVRRIGLLTYQWKTSRKPQVPGFKRLCG